MGRQQCRGARGAHENAALPGWPGLALAALPCLAWPGLGCLAWPGPGCFAMPGLALAALPCLALPCLALPCLALPGGALLPRLGPHKGGVPFILDGLKRDGSTFQSHIPPTPASRHPTPPHPDTHAHVHAGCGDRHGQDHVHTQRGDSAAERWKLSGGDSILHGNTAAGGKHPPPNAYAYQAEEVYEGSRAWAQSGVMGPCRQLM
jgi:hypothetical protein